jgi:hypothetical protein
MARLLLLIVIAFPAAPAAAQSGRWPPHRDEGLHLRILRDYTLRAGETSPDPVVVLGGTATIDGTAGSDVVVIGGTLRLGPTAIVRGDAVAIASAARIDPAAQVFGDLDHVSIVGPNLDALWSEVSRGGWWAVAAFAATLLRLGLIFIVSALLTLVTPGWILGFGDRGAATWTSAFIGVLTQLLFVPGLIVLTVTLAASVIGIPLLAGLPLLVGACGLLWAAGFAGTAVRLGRHLRGSRDATHVFGDLLAGFAAISALTVAAHLVTLGPAWLHGFGFALGTAGLFVEYVAWTIGLGAAVAATLGGRHASPPFRGRMPMPATSL